jgi:hypothetical protein
MKNIKKLNCAVITCYFSVSRINLRERIEKHIEEKFQFEEAQ